jgi:hypothetical protein
MTAIAKTVVIRSDQSKGLGSGLSFGMLAVTVLAKLGVRTGRQNLLDRFGAAWFWRGSCRGEECEAGDNQKRGGKRASQGKP